MDPFLITVLDRKKIVTFEQVPPLYTAFWGSKYGFWDPRSTKTIRENPRSTRVKKENEFGYGILCRIQKVTQNDFLTFVKAVWPDFVEGKHHRIYAEKLNRIANGELKRLIVNMPPRHTKSEFASHLFPAFFMGRHPKAKLIQTTHTGELAIRFGRKAKNMIEFYI